MKPGQPRTRRPAATKEVGQAKGSSESFGRATLVDTQLLLWAAFEPDRLSYEVRPTLESTDRALYFSLATIWEVALKTSLGRRDFDIDPALFHRGLLREGFLELPITAKHLFAVGSLPWLHRDPFDRLLIAQAMVEGMDLLTADATLHGYGRFVVGAPPHGQEKRKR